MTEFLKQLAGRRRFGMRPGLEAIAGLMASLGNPERQLKSIHIAGTNGKGAVAAILDAALRHSGQRIGRYTSPHLMRLSERYFLDGQPMAESVLDEAARKVAAVAPGELTFFEALTAVAFLVYHAARPDFTILETGLGGRLDATNICSPCLTVITRIGLDHCDWLGDTLEKIAAEKAGIVKAGVPIILGKNEACVRQVVEARAREVGSPFFYAPELANEREIPSEFSLSGGFNRENAVTAIAALKVLFGSFTASLAAGFGEVVWPGRCQAIGRFIVDGAHNPPAAHALFETLSATGERFTLIAGFCGDKDVETVLRTLAPLTARGIAVQTANPRSLAAGETAARMSAVGMVAHASASLSAALAEARRFNERILVCGSLFLAGEALVELGAYPWGAVDGLEPAELLR